ncbi:MAG: hypothetical protein QM811_01250 [Pirellulales bacterium]
MERPNPYDSPQAELAPTSDPTRWTPRYAALRRLLIVDTMASACMFIFLTGIMLATQPFQLAGIFRLFYASLIVFVLFFAVGLAAFAVEWVLLRLSGRANASSSSDHKDVK